MYSMIFDVLGYRLNANTNNIFLNICVLLYCISNFIIVCT